MLFRYGNYGYMEKEGGGSSEASTVFTISTLFTISKLSTQSVLVGPDQVQLRLLQERGQAVRLPHAQVVPGWER